MLSKIKQANIVGMDNVISIPTKQEVNMPLKKPFTLIDFYESLSIIDAVKVDFDNSYPHHTRKLNDWLSQWAPRLLAREEEDMKVFFQALPCENGLLLVNPDNVGSVIHIPWVVDRTDVLVGAAALINLSQCTTFRSVINVLTHLRKDDWGIEYPAMKRDDFVNIRRKEYQALRERLL